MSSNYMQKVGKLKRSLLEEVFPHNSCLCCNKSLAGNLWAGASGYVCDPCHKEINDYKRCQVCGSFMFKWANSVLPGKMVCSFCRGNSLDNVAGLVSFAPYQGVLKQNILALKYHNKRSFARPMGEMVARQILLQPWEIHALVAIPLYPQKEKARGYNQAELLALKISDCLNLPYYANGVVRAKDTLVQNKLSRQERAINLKDAFAPGKDIAKVKGKNILIVDDIITSGLTIANCAEVLAEAGAGLIYGCGVAAALEFREKIK